MAVYSGQRTGFRAGHHVLYHPAGHIQDKIVIKIRYAGDKKIQNYPLEIASKVKKQERKKII